VHIVCPLPVVVFRLSCIDCCVSVSAVMSVGILLSVIFYTDSLSKTDYMKCPPARLLNDFFKQCMPVRLFEVNGGWGRVNNIFLESGPSLRHTLEGNRMGVLQTCFGVWPCLRTCFWSLVPTASIRMSTFKEGQNLKVAFAKIAELVTPPFCC
jgi:hypothetical protein